MVTACKSYITESGLLHVWEVDPSVLLQRLAACQRLYTIYQESFHQSKKRVESGPRPFEISETYVFGKFSSFVRRLDQIKAVVDTEAQFSSLRHAHIDGGEMLATRLNSIISNFKKKPYNPLDHRKAEFKLDFDDLMRQVANLETQLVGFMTGSFEQVSSVMQTLWLLQRYSTPPLSPSPSPHITLTPLNGTHTSHSLH